MCVCITRAVYVCTKVFYSYHYTRPMLAIRASELQTSHCVIWISSISKRCVFAQIPHPYACHGQILTSAIHPEVSPAGCKPAASAGTALLNWGAAKLGPLTSASVTESPRVAPVVGFYEHVFKLVLPSAAQCIKQSINRCQSA